MKRICILTFEGNPIAANLFVLLKKRHEVFLLFSENTNLSYWQIWRRKRGLRWFWYNHLFTFAARIYNASFEAQVEWPVLKTKYSRKFLFVENHNSNISKNILEKLNVDLGILIGTSLIKPAIFNLPAKGMMNLHQGNIPNFRGAPPAFWEHYYRSSRMFVTVHTVVEKLDAGNILEERSFPIREHGHFVISKDYANSLSVGILVKAVEKVFAGNGSEERKSSIKARTVPGICMLLVETCKLIGIYFKKKCLWQRVRS